MCRMVMSSQANYLIFDTRRFLARRLALLGLDKDWLAQCRDNATEWDIRVWCWFGACSPSGASLLSHHECALSKFGTHPDMTLDIART